MPKRKPQSQWESLSDDEKVDYLIPLTTRWHRCLDILMDKKVDGAPLCNQVSNIWSVLKSVEVAVNTYRHSFVHKEPSVVFAHDSADFVIDTAPYGYRAIQQFEDFMERNSEDTFVFDMMDLQITREIILNSLNYIMLNRLDGGPSRKYDVTKLPASYKDMNDEFLTELLIIEDFE